jgi:hypothetical protein
MNRQQHDSKNNEHLTAPKKNGGGSANINSCAFNKHCAGSQFSASNPPLLLAAKRYGQVKKTYGLRKPTG